MLAVEWSRFFARDWRLDWNGISALVGVMGLLLAYALWQLDRRNRHQSAQSHAAAENPFRNSPLPSTLPLPDVQVSLRHGVLTFPHGRLSDDMLILQATNTTPRPIRITSIGVRIDGTDKVMILMRPDSAPRLPCVLPETETLTAWFRYNEVVETLKGEIRPRGPYGLTGFARDSYDREHLGETLTVDE